MKTNILGVISDPTRFSILSALSNYERCACGIPTLVKKSQPAVSQHLAVLKSVGLVVMRRDGARRMYSLTPKAKRVLRDVSKW